MGLNIVLGFLVFFAVWGVLLWKTKSQPPVKEIFSFFIAVYAGMFTAGTTFIIFDYWYLWLILALLTGLGYNVYKTFEHNKSVEESKRIQSR